MYIYIWKNDKKIIRNMEAAKEFSFYKTWKVENVKGTRCIGGGYRVIRKKNII